MPIYANIKSYLHSLALIYASKATYWNFIRLLTQPLI